jgi:signal transduction histidine kinase
MRYPLKMQILVPFAILICVGVLGLTLLNALSASRRVKAETEARLRGIATALYDTSFPLNEPVLKRMRGLSGADFLVVDASQNILAASRESLKYSDSDSIGARRPAGLEGPMTVDGESFFHMAALIDGTGRQSGGNTLHILYPENSYRDARWTAVYPSLLIGAVALVATGFLSVWIANRLSRPLQSICAHIGRLAAADFQALPVPSRNDEVRDVVTAINHLAAELGSMRQTIGQSERLALLGQLSAGMIHSLRNDVTGARMAVQLHQRQCRQNDQESIEVALRQLTLTEEHLKRFLAAGKNVAVRPVTTNLGDLLAEVGELLAPTLKHRRIQLVTSLSTIEPLQLDADQIRQTVIALMMNAMDATGTQGRIELRLDDADTEVCIAVIDGGTGVAAASADRIFQAFVTTKPEGVGLGLTAAQRTAEAHGGTLGHRRCQGQTIFELRLPKTSPVATQAEVCCA